MKRRSFLAGGVAAGAALAAANTARATAQDTPERSHAPFKLKYAPHFGMFRHHAGNDVVDQIKFMYDQGFTALEDNGMKGRSVQDQERIANEMARLGMTMGVFVAYGDFERPTFAVDRPDFREEVLASIRNSIEVAKRVNAKWVTVVPGTIDQQYKSMENWNSYAGPRLAPGYQTANVIQLLRECAAILEPHGIVMVLEPLNWRTDHGGLFLERSDQAYAICKAVDSPSCKILFDIYHQQITEGNLIPNINRCWDEIAYFQTGDNPGRKEPTTGEINYPNVFKHIHGKGWEGVLGMEHGNSKSGKEGEQAVIDAYRYCDDF